jgi:hypothetical protein
MQNPEKWRQIKDLVSGITDQAQLEQLDFIIQKPEVPPKQAIHEGTNALQMLIGRRNRCQQAKTTTKNALTKHQLYKAEMFEKLEQEEERLSKEAIDADCLWIQAQAELNEAQETHDKGMEALVAGRAKAPAADGAQDVDMDPSPEEIASMAQAEQGMQAMVQELAFQLIQKGAAAKAEKPADIQMDEAGKRSITQSVQEQFSGLRKAAGGAPRATKVARISVAPGVAEDIQHKAEQAKKGL